MRLNEAGGMVNRGGRIRIVSRPSGRAVPSSRPISCANNTTCSASAEEGKRRHQRAAAPDGARSPLRRDDDPQPTPSQTPKCRQHPLCPRPGGDSIKVVVRLALPV